MHPIAAFCRRNLNALGLELYSIAYPLLPKDRRDWLFEKNVNIVPAETGVKIIDKDEESITIGKFNKDVTYSDRPFRILTTTDIHLGDTPSLRRKAMQMLANHIAQAKPDLVIFTGDIILSKFQQLDAVQFARFMEKTGVYWAIVFGNHEVHEEKGFYKWLMLDSMRRYPHCLALHGNDSLYGYGNYRIDIKNGENSLLQSLYLFDSGRDIRERYYKDYGVPEGMKGYDFLKPEQIEWYKNCVRRTEEKYGKVKSMMYFHIPLPEFEEYINVMLGGEAVSQVYDDGKSFDLTVKTSDASRATMDDISNLMIDAAGQKVPLSYVADIRSVTGPNTINRENVQRKIVISANVSERDLRSVVNEIQDRVEANIRLPEGYHIEYGGQFESEAAASRTLLLTSLMSLLVIFMLLYNEFKDVKESGVILLNLPLALIGGVIILWLTSGEISIPAIIGFISLFGIATRNGMLLISHYTHLRGEGMGLRESVIQGSLDRLNPILMTALSSALALIPLALNGDLPGNEIQSPMATVILGGLLTSTFLNGFIIPIVYLIMNKNKE